MRIKKYRIGNIVQNPENPIYEFMESGQGLSMDGWVPNSSLIDRGTTPVFYQPPADQSLALMSDRDESDCFVTVRGLDAQGKEVRSANGTAGETFQLGSANEQLISRLSFKTITSVTKTLSKGYVTLHSLNAATNALSLLAKYPAALMTAGFRQYRIPGYNFMTDDTPDLTAIYALVLTGMPNPQSDDDVIRFDDIQAIKMVARSLYMMDREKYQEAKVEGLTGMSMAKESVGLSIPTRSMPDIECKNFMMGDVETL
jgi:hypothetical protein